MKMKFKKSLSMGLALILTLSVFLASPISRIESKAYNVKTTDKGTYPMKNWMDDSWALIKDKPFKDVVLLYGHDSGTYESDYGSFSPSQSFYLDSKYETLLKIANFGLFNIPYKIAKNSALCQSQNIYDQLQTGYRTLDIRFKRSMKNNQIRIFHGIFGPTTDEIFVQIRDFLKANPNEIIQIDLNIGGNYQGFENDEEGKKFIAEKFKQYLGDLTIKKSDNLSAESTLEEIKASGKRVIPAFGNVKNYLTEFGFVSTPSGLSYSNYKDTWSGNIKGGRNYDGVLKAYNYKDYNDFKALVNKNGSTKVGNTVYSQKVNALLAFRTDEITFSSVFKGIPSITDTVEKSRESFKSVILDIGSGKNDPAVSGFARDNADVEEHILAFSRNLGTNVDDRLNTLNEYLNKNDAESKRFVNFYNGLQKYVAPSRQYDLYGEKANPLSSGVYVIKPAHAQNKALDAFDVNKDGGKVSIWDYHGGNNQRWYLSYKEGYCYIVNMAGKERFLDINKGSDKDGTHLQTWNKNMTMAQRFRLIPTSDGYFEIQPLCCGGSNKVLDVYKRSTKNGAEVSVYKRNGQTNQKWKVVKVG